MLYRLVIHTVKKKKGNQKKLYEKKNVATTTSTINWGQRRRRRRQPQLKALTKRLAGSENWPSDLGRELCACVCNCVYARYTSNPAPKLDNKKKKQIRKRMNEKRKYTKRDDEKNH